MRIVPAIELLSRVKPKSPIMCLVACRTGMLGKEHLSFDQNSFGLALADANWRYAAKSDYTTHPVDVENAVTDHNVSGIVFSLPFKESLVPSPDVYRYEEEVNRLKYERTCLIEYLQMFSKNAGILACLAEAQPDLEEACRLAEEGKAPYAEDLDLLHSRRKPKFDFDLDLDAVVALNQFLAKYSPEVSSSNEPPPDSLPIGPRKERPSELHQIDH